MDIELIGNHQPLAFAQVIVVKTDEPEAFNALGIIIFGHQVNASPHPAQLVKPAPDRLVAGIGGFSLNVDREKNPT
jgi:hypothetical protein